MLKEKPGIRMGTCSWTYPEWPLYTKKYKKAADYLGEYSRVFDTAEIDSWFYKPPDAETVREYGLNTPEGFVFTAKVPSLLTKPILDDRPNEHFLNPESYARFLEVAAGLGKKLGALIFQFEYMNLLKMAGLDFFLSALERFLAKADRSFPVAVETRNGNYLTQKYFSFLSAHGLSPVLSQKIYMPDIVNVWGKAAGLKTEKAVLRLLGDDRQEIEKKSGGQWNSLIDEKPEKPRIVEMVRRMREDGIEIFLNINNHYEGSAILTAEFFRREFGSASNLIF